LGPNVVGDDDKDSTELPSRRVRIVVDGFAAKRWTWGATGPFNADHTGSTIP